MLNDLLIIARRQTFLPALPPSELHGSFTSTCHHQVPALHPSTHSWLWLLYASKDLLHLEFSCQVLVLEAKAEAGVSYTPHFFLACGFWVSEEDHRKVMTDGETMYPHHHWCRIGRIASESYGSKSRAVELFQCPSSLLYTLGDCFGR